jgi:hypothetical protein
MSGHFVKTLLLVLATAAVSGCAVYPAPYHGGYGAPRAQVVVPPVTVYGSGVYRYDDDGRAHPNRPRTRDQDRDGVPNRYDRDRDGDGVPNRWDARPGDPRSR